MHHFKILIGIKRNEVKRKKKTHHATIHEIAKQLARLKLKLR